MQSLGIGIGRSIVGFVASDLAGLAADAERGIVEQAKRSIGNRNLLRFRELRAGGHGQGCRHSSLGDIGK